MSILLLFIELFFLALFLTSSFFVRYRSLNLKPRLVWGSTQIINYGLWSSAMKFEGYSSTSFVNNIYSINAETDFDKLLINSYPWCPLPLRKYVAFLYSLFAFDIFFISLDGYFLGESRLFKHFQAQILHFAGKKVVVLPYGSDAYEYSRIRSPGTMHAIQKSYPVGARQQDRIQSRVRYWIKHADAFIPALMSGDGFGRWDVIVPNTLTIDLNKWKPNDEFRDSDGKFKKVFIYHSPNHRGFKGTEFLINAVNELVDEGHNVELIVLENVTNQNLRLLLRQNADIFVEQLIATGFGMSAIEGMALGLPVISNLEDDEYLNTFRRWSYFSECPVVSGSPETIKEVLRQLVTKPELRKELGKLGRSYAEKYHGYESSKYLFEAVIDFVYGKRDSLMDLYHPISGEYPKRLPRIYPPLNNNRII